MEGAILGEVTEMTEENAQHVSDNDSGCDLLGTDDESDSSSSEEDFVRFRQHETHPGDLIRRTRQRPYEPLRNRNARSIAALEHIRLVREVEDLRRRHDELMALYMARLLDTGRRDHLITTVLEYYDTFSRGYLPPRVADIFQYLNARIDREVFQYGATGYGTEEWLEQWQRYTAIFPAIAIRVRATSCSHLVNLHDVGSITDPTTTTCLVHAQGWMGGKISRQAIATILPHVISQEHLVSKLVGKPLDCPVNIRFYFNSFGRVIRIDLDVDFFTGFSKVDGVSCIELAQIMEHADVGENSMLPVVQSLMSSLEIN